VRQLSFSANEAAVGWIWEVQSWMVNLW